MVKHNPAIAYLALAFICLTWGTTYLALRIGVTHFPPFLFIVVRQLIAGGILSGLMLTLGRAQMPPREELLRFALGGLFMFSFANGLIAWAEVYIPSSIAAIICSFMPMWIILLNLAVNREERPTLPVFVGTSLGLLGIVIIFSEHIASFANLHYLGGIVLTFVATFCWSAGSMWIKKYEPKSNLFLGAGLQMLFGGIWLIPFSLVFDDYSQLTWSVPAGYSLVYLIVVGSILSYICYFYALKKLPITLVSLYAYINPLVAVLLGWLILDEKLNMNIAIGFLTTVLGIYLVNRGYQLRQALRAQFSR